MANTTRRRGRPRKLMSEQAHSLTVRLYAADRARLDALRSRWELDTDTDALRKAVQICADAEA